MSDNQQSMVVCSFCSDDSDKVEVMVKGKDGAICSACITLCVGVMAQALGRRARTFHMLPDPTTSHTKEI